MAGVLLLHMSEEQAFEMLKFLMYDLGFRKQYRPDMMSLQVRQKRLQFGPECFVDVKTIIVKGSDGPLAEFILPTNCVC